MTQRARGRTLPTRQELAVWRDYIETAEALRSELATRLQADAGLSSGDYVVLLALTEAPDTTLRSSALADEIGWDRSRLSHHLGRMQRRNLIERRDCDEDGRGSDIAATAEGIAAFRAATVPHLRAVRAHFVDALTEEQLAQAGEIAAALREHLRAIRAPRSC